MFKGVWEENDTMGENTDADGGDRWMKVNVCPDCGSDVEVKDDSVEELECLACGTVFDRD